MTIRKNYSKECELGAVSLLIDQEYSRTEAARSHGVSANMLGERTSGW